MAAHHLTSRASAARTELEVQGYEIDIITPHGEFIVFTEVKTRASTEWGYPEESVTGNGCGAWLGLPTST